VHLGVFLCVKDVTVCHLQWKNLVLKNTVLRGNYETTHILQLCSLQGQSGKDKISQLLKCLRQRQNLFKATALQSDTAVHASYAVSGILAKKK
jgi:hypothetical protein